MKRSFKGDYIIIYKQTTPMQWLTFYYYGDDEDKINTVKQSDLQMRRKIRYSDAIEELEQENAEILHDSEKCLVGITNSNLIIMFENNVS